MCGGVEVGGIYFFSAVSTIVQSIQIGKNVMIVAGSDVLYYISGGRGIKGVPEKKD